MPIYYPRYCAIISMYLLANCLNGQIITKGLILPNEGFDVCCYYIPTSGLKVYEQPNGSVVGELTLGESDNNNEIYSANIKINSELRKFSHTNLEMVGYELWLWFSKMPNLTMFNSKTDTG